MLPAGLGTNVAISPDGQSLAYVAPGAGGLLQLYLRPLDEFGATPIPGTEGAIEPFFSPDGEWIAFWSQVGNRLSRIPRSGGEPFLLCEQCSHGFWGDDDSILFARNGALWRMPGTGGTAELLVGPMPDRGVPALDRPVLLPGGQAVLFEIGLLGFGGIGVLSLDTGEYVQVSDNGANPLYSPTGHILFARGSTLFGVPFDAEELTVTGPVVPVVQGVRVENGGALQARVSPNGLLVYVPASEATGTRLVWVDRDGGVVDSVFDEPRVFNAPRLSPTGEQIAVQINDEGNNDIWIHNVEARNTLKLTTTGDATNPVWSPDGSQVAFGSGSAGSFAIQSIAPDGGRVTTLLESGSPALPETWSPDGSHLVFRDSSSSDLFVIDVDDPGSRRAVLNSGFAEHSATFSPSGRLLAYVSNRSGRNEIYVRQYPGDGVGQVVSDGVGIEPTWGRDDSELYYRVEPGSLWVASLEAEPFRVSRQLLFQSSQFWASTFGGTHYDFNPEGQRFLMLNMSGAAGGARSKINVVLNWFEELKERVPIS